MSLETLKAISGTSLLLNMKLKTKEFFLDFFLLKCSIFISIFNCSCTMGGEMMLGAFKKEQVPVGDTVKFTITGMSFRVSRI